MMSKVIEFWDSIDKASLYMSAFFFFIGIIATYTLPRRERVWGWIGEKRTTASRIRLNSRAKRKYYTITEYLSLSSRADMYYRWELDHITRIVFYTCLILCLRMFFAPIVYIPIAACAIGFLSIEFISRRQVKSFFNNHDKLINNIRYVAENMKDLSEHQAAAIFLAAGMVPANEYLGAFKKTNMRKAKIALDNSTIDQETIDFLIERMPSELQIYTTSPMDIK